MDDLYCPQCGEDTDQLHEGYCLECAEQNHFELLRHNYEYDRWQKMTDEERSAAIKVPR